MQFYRAFVGFLQLCESGAEAFGGIWHIFHDVRCAPDFLDSDFLVVGKHGKGILKGLHTVIHTEKDVAMTVCHPLENTAAHQRLPTLHEVEQSHILLTFVTVSVAIGSVSIAVA